MKSSGKFDGENGRDESFVRLFTTRTNLTLILVMFLCAGMKPLVLGQNVDSGAVWLPYLLSADGVLPTYGTSVAIDANGGVHVAYAIFIGSEQGLRPAIYAYCPGGCADKGNWTFTRIGEVVHDVRIALSPEGLPRLMLFGPKADPDTDFRFQYQYAECNGGCTDAQNWTITTVVTPMESVATREEDNNHYFAISPQGEAAFIYTDTLNNQAAGSYYMSCPGGCADLTNWTQTTLSTKPLVDKPSLAFSEDGHPRIACGLFSGDGELNLIYLQCDGESTNPANWSATLLGKIHGTAMYSLRVNSSGEPRLAFSSGAYAEAPFDAYQLYYLWCTNGCASSVTNWSFNNVGVPLTVGNVDLALDSQNRPRISYLNAEGLALAWCNEDAESGSAKWQRKLVESNNSLAHNYEVLPIHHCTVSRWVNGERCSLALDRQGNPGIGYDAQHIWSGVYVDRPWENCYLEDVTITRFATLTLAPTLSLKRSGDELEIGFTNGTLEFAHSVNGPWKPVLPSVSPLRITTDQLRTFYRVRD